MDGGLRHCTGGSDQAHPQEKEMQNGKVAVSRGFTNSWEKKRSERQRRKLTECRVPKNSKESNKAFLSDQCKEIEGNNRTGKTRDLLKNIRGTKGTFHAKMGTIKDRNGMDLTEAEDIKKRWQEYTEELYKKARKFQKNIYSCFIDYSKAFDCMDHNKLWKILKEMGIPDHLTCLLRNLYEATVRTGHGTTDRFQIGKGVCQDCMLSPC